MCINIATTVFHTVNCAHFQHHNQVNWQSVYLIRQVRTWYDSLTAYQIACRRPSSFTQLLGSGSNRNRPFEVHREFILTHLFVTSSRLCLKSPSATFCYCMLLIGDYSKSRWGFGTQTPDPRPKTPDPRTQNPEPRTQNPEPRTHGIASSGDITSLRRKSSELKNPLFERWPDEASRWAPVVDIHSWQLSR